MIDIDLSLAKMDEDPTVLIDLGDGSMMEIIIEPLKQRKLIDRYCPSGKINASAETIDKILARKEELGKDELTADDVQDMAGDSSIEIDTGGKDFYGLGVALSDYFTGWRGFKGPFNKAKAKAYFKRFGQKAIALGQQFDDLLRKYEEAHLVIVEQEEKNS